MKDIEWDEPEPVYETEELPLLMFEPLAADFNGNGMVDDDDLEMIKKYIIGNTRLNKYKDDKYSDYVKPEYASLMDINKDGIVDEVDYSIAINLAKGKEIHGVPGSSKDNPLYLVMNKSDSVHVPKGEYVNTDELHGEKQTFYVDENGKWHINADNDKSSDDKEISTYANNVFVECGDYSKIRIYGEEPIVNVNYDKDNAVNYSEFFGRAAKIITVYDSKATIIRDKGSDKDVFALSSYSEIQNNDDSPFVIRIADYIRHDYGKYLISLKKINGIPAIVRRNGEPVALLKGKINSETSVVGYGSNRQWGWNDESVKLKDLPGADEIFKTDETNLNITPNPNNPNEWFMRYTQIVNADETFDIMDYDGNVKGKVTVSAGNEITLTKAYDKIVLVTPNLITEGGTVTVTEGPIALKLDGKDYIKNSEGTATYTKEGNKVKINAMSAMNLETTEYGDNVEIKAFVGDNAITLNGKNGKVDTGIGNDTIKIEGSGNVVNTGDGNDTVDIRGENSVVYLNSGENSVNIKGANAYVQAGNGRDKIHIAAPGSMIFNFNPNEDTLSFSYGKLTAEAIMVGEYPSILIKNAWTGKPVASLINSTDLGKVQEILNEHNKDYSSDIISIESGSNMRGYVGEAGGVVISDFVTSESSKGITNVSMNIHNLKSTNAMVTVYNSDGTVYKTYPVEKFQRLPASLVDVGEKLGNWFQDIIRDIKQKSKGEENVEWDNKTSATHTSLNFEAPVGGRVEITTNSYQNSELAMYNAIDTTIDLIASMMGIVCSSDVKAPIRNQILQTVSPKQMEAFQKLYKELAETTVENGIIFKDVADFCYNAQKELSFDIGNVIKNNVRNLSKSAIEAAGTVAIALAPGGAGIAAAYGLIKAAANLGNIVCQLYDFANSNNQPSYNIMLS